MLGLFAYAPRFITLRAGTPLKIRKKYLLAASSLHIAPLQRLPIRTILERKKNKFLKELKV